MMLNELFNADFKLTYLDTIDNERTRYETLLAIKKVTQFEYYFSKDICEFNQDEILFTLENCIFDSDFIFNRFKSFINGYINYMINNRYTNKCHNDFYDVVKKYQFISPICNKYPKDDVDLYENLKILFDEPKKDSQYIFCFAFLCLAYCGFSDDEILKLTSNDIDIDSYTIQGCKISDVLWTPIINALNTQILFIRGGKQKQAPIEQSGYIIKYTVKNFVKVLRETIVKCKTEVTNQIFIKNISINNVRRAGKFFDYYATESNGGSLKLSPSEQNEFQKYKQAYWE